jgi:hypothetical protein
MSFVGYDYVKQRGMPPGAIEAVPNGTLDDL